MWASLASRAPSRRVLASGHAAVTQAGTSCSPSPSLVPAHPLCGTAVLSGRTTGHKAKDKIDAARGKRFAMLTNIIALAAREGKDPDFNPKLQVEIAEREKRGRACERSEARLTGVGEINRESLERSESESAMMRERDARSHRRLVSLTTGIIFTGGDRRGSKGASAEGQDHPGDRGLRSQLNHLPCRGSEGRSRDDRVSPLPRPRARSTCGVPCKTSGRTFGRRLLLRVL